MILDADASAAVFFLVFAGSTGSDRCHAGRGGHCGPARGERGNCRERGGTGARGGGGGTEAEAAATSGRAEEEAGGHVNCTKPIEILINLVNFYEHFRMHIGWAVDGCLPVQCWRAQKKAVLSQNLAARFPSM